MEEDTNERNLELLAPRLHAIPKVDPFVVPPDLFVHFPHQVQSVVGRRNTSATAPWLRRLAVALPLVALIAVATWMISDTKAPVRADGSLVIEDPSMSELLLMQDANDWNELVLVSEDPDLSMDLGTDISRNEIALYFDRNGTDITELLTEL